MSKAACVVISLLLGIIIGLAAVVGGVFLVLSINVDTLLGWVGLEDDNKNEDGTYVYIAGDQSLLKTINDTIDFFSNLDTSTLAGLNEFIPAVGLAVNNVADYLWDSTGVDLDVDGLMETPINDLGDWLSDWVREIQLYPVVEKLLPDYIEGDDVMAVIVRALVLGVEADYYTDENGDRYPVYYYTVNSGSISPDAVKFLADGDEEDESGGEDVVYYYYYIDASGTAQYLEKLEDGTYQPVGKVYEGYSEDTATCTGDYYREETEGGYEYVIVDPVVLGDFYDSENLSESIYAISLDELLGEGDLADLLGDYTIGDLVNDGIDFNEFEVADFIDLNPETDDLLISIIYGINQLEKSEDGTWTGIYNDDDGPHEVTIELDESGCIDRAYYTVEDDNGNETVVEVAGVTLGGISESLSGLELVTVMGYPDVTDALMMYILYGVTDVYKEYDEETEEYVYYATYTRDGVEYTAEITVTTETDDDGNVTTRATSSSYEDPENPELRISTATNLDNISDVTDNILDALSVADFVGDVDVADAIFMYLCYGVYDVYQDENGDWHGYKKITTTVEVDGVETEVTSEKLVDIFMKDGDGPDYIDHISYEDENGDIVRLKGTKITEISGIVDGLMEDLTLVAFIGDVETDNALMAYLMYSITGIESHVVTPEDDGEPYTEWTATYHTGVTDQETGEEITFEVILETRTEYETDANGDETEIIKAVYITGIHVSDEESSDYIKYIESYGRVRGATINEINDQIDGLMEYVPIRDIIDLGDEGNIILNAIGDATINTLGDAINNITVQSLFPEDIYSNTATLFVDYTDSSYPVYAYDDAMGYTLTEAESYYAGYEFCYRVGSETDGYTYYQLTYTVDGEVTSITDRDALNSAVCAYNESAEDAKKITYVYIFTATYRQAIIPCDSCVCDDCGCGGDCECGDECTCDGCACDGCSCACACNCENGEYCEEIGVCTCCYIYDEYFLKYADGSYVVMDGKYVVNNYIVFSGDYLYYDADWNLVNGDGKLSMEAFKEMSAEGKTVYTYGEVTGVWKFMLCDISGGSYNEQICGINDVGDLMTTTEKNLMSATLMDFYEIGILDVDRTTLDTPIPEGYGIDAATVGDLSLNQAIELMVAMISSLPTDGGTGDTP